MALIDQLFPASYKGVPFLVRRSQIAGGQKDVLKEFINSNVQSIEDLGRLPRTYNLGAIISEPFYILKRDRLLKVLEEGGVGVLIHPFYGRIENIKARSFTAQESESILGESTFNIVFAPSETDGRPIASINTVSLLSQLVSEVFGSVTDDVTSLFEVTSTFSGNFDAAVSKVDDIVEAFENNSRTLATIPDKINEFNSQLDQLANNAATLIGKPAELAATLESLFTEFPKLFDSPEGQTEALSLFSGFGSSDILINPTTAGLIERVQNSEVINAAMQTYSLAQSYVSAAKIGFSTVSQITNTANKLENSFKSIKNLFDL